MLEGISCTYFRGPGIACLTAFKESDHKTYGQWLACLDGCDIAKVEHSSIPSGCIFMRTKMTFPSLVTVYPKT